ncbi:hypothetical protein ACJX0J_008161, partial [Zea mays]
MTSHYYFLDPKLKGVNYFDILYYSLHQSSSHGSGNKIQGSTGRQMKWGPMTEHSKRGLMDAVIDFLHKFCKGEELVLDAHSDRLL